MPGLEIAIDAFVVFIRSHNYRISREDTEYGRLSEAINQIIKTDAYNGVRYRTVIRHLESVLKEAN